MERIRITEACNGVKDPHRTDQVLWRFEAGSALVLLPYDDYEYFKVNYLGDVVFVPKACAVRANDSAPSQPALPDLLEADVPQFTPLKGRGTAPAPVMDPATLVGEGRRDDDVGAPVVLETRTTSDRTQISTNAFETIGLAALSTTADLRKASSLAHVRQAMASTGGPDVAASIIERLLNEPAYRLREAAAWYFVSPTASEAAKSDREAPLSHDRLLMRWQAVGADAARGEYSRDKFQEACAATAQLLNNPSAWQPLDALVREIADVRLDSGAVVLAATMAAERWTCAALLAMAAAGDADILDAAETTIAQVFTDEVVYAIRASVLARAAQELTDVTEDTKSRVEPLLNQIEKDSSVAAALGREAEDLVAVSRPWWALVDAFDDDPDVGEEGRALDDTAGLVRGCAVALFNDADDVTRARRLIEFAQEIAQSSALKLSLAEDLRRVSYLAARSDVVKAFEAGDASRATSHLQQLRRHVARDDEQEEAAQLELLVQRLRASGARASQRRGTSRPGTNPLGLLVGLVRFVVVLAILVGIISAITGAVVKFTSDSSSGNAPSGGSNSQATEGVAIDLERSRLDRVQSELGVLQAEVDRLRRDLDSTDAQYPDGLPPGIFAQYESDRRRHNVLVDEYNAKLASYQSDVAAFNRRVEAYNSTR